MSIVTEESERIVKDTHEMVECDWCHRREAAKGNGYGFCAELLAEIVGAAGYRVDQAYPLTWVLLRRGGVEPESLRNPCGFCSWECVASYASVSAQEG